MPNKVVSKYFSNETGMDDSLSDFQERKKYNTGPKNVKTTRNNKKPKRARGQKDIRTLIKKENDVLSYSKDFDKVCKESGVDVDSEELQLAIALSKSLNDAKKDNISEIETKSTEQCTSRQRTLKLKTTLQEYGFRVPKAKITETNRRNRSKKQYKLLLISETERQQIISDKYSEVLAGNIFKSPEKVSDSNYSDKELYYKTTNIAYEHIKNDDVYYVKDLFDKSGHKNCLLRDWSEIPGRPLSPKVEVNNINFDEIICDQHELDCILSGTIIAAQQIVTNKNHDPAHNSILKAVQHFPHSKPLVNEVGNNNAIGIELSKENIPSKEVSCYTNSNTMSVSQARCISPDLFDDEVSVVTECPDTDVQLSGQTLSKSDNIHTYCMDLTECVNIDSYNSDLSAKTKLWTNNENNIPNRRSNDLMEITECVSTSSKQINVEKVDLTQSSNEQTDDILSQNENNEVMDVTQVPDYNPLLEEISKTEKNNFLDDTIIVVDDDINSEQQLHKQKLSLREFPEAICIDALNNGKSGFSSENAKGQSYQRLSNHCKDHLFDKSYKSNCDYKKQTLKTIEKVAEHKNKLVECPLDSLDLTQSSNSSEGETLTNQRISNYSPSLGKRDNISIDYDEIDIVSVTSFKSDKVYKYENNSVENEVSESNKDVASNPNKSSGPFTFFEKESNYSLLHSKHDTSVEHGNYYEISNHGNYYAIDSVPITSLRSNECHRYEINSIEKEANVSNKNIVLNSNRGLAVFETFKKESKNSVIKSKRDENGSPVKEAFNSNNDIALSPSKSSEVFKISDKEFTNYSIHQSVYENFDFRDVSVMNYFSNYKNYSVGECSHYSTTENRLLSESNLQRGNITSPQKEVAQSQKLNFNSETSNVIRMPQGNIKNVLNTPKNGDYIINTNDVTPMLDYASMSSPERHKELEKYGLKPFKRKRAIQLLTYMYNQTHPVVELHDNSCPSPSKRQKRDDGDETISSPKNTPKCESLASLTSKAPVKPIESIPEVNKENNLYAVTTEQPDIRNIECGFEDWFFQKREKAKVYSCRVPLHVAFHNYVSCRRRLREAILRYEPVNIDVIHKELVAAGYRYNPKDLLKFMDRKCITVKTAENNSRNRKS